MSVEWEWPSEYIRPLSTAIERQVREVSRNDPTWSRMMLATIRFDGTVEPRGTKAASIKGKLYRAEPGEVVYSKIDVRNGAIGIVPESMPLVALTSEFPVYQIRKTQAAPEYIKLLLRTSFFRRLINSLISGASGRKRVQPSELESLSVPLPPLSIQQEIVANWRGGIGEVKKLEEAAVNFQQMAAKKFLHGLGLVMPEHQAPQKIMAMRWSDLSRWGVAAASSRLHSSSVDGKFPSTSVGEIARSIQYGTSTKPNQRGRGVPIIRMNNIKDGALDVSDLKFVEIADPELERLRLHSGDILFNRTNSKELVGKCAVYRDIGTEAVFASYLIRVRVDEARALPEYVAFFLNGPLGRLQINAASRQIIGQANINSVELRALRVPLPPIDRQKRIMAAVEALAEKSSAARGQANELRTRVEENVEMAILARGGRGEWNSRAS